MTLNRVLDQAAELDVTITNNDGMLKIAGPQSAIKEVAILAKPHKQELLNIASGQTVDDVGHCDDCGSVLLGLTTFDRYVNRTCPNCGRWCRCLTPTTTQEIKSCSERSEPIQQKWLPDARTPDSLVTQLSRS